MRALHRLGVALLVFAALAAGCGGDDDTAANRAPAPDLTRPHPVAAEAELAIATPRVLCSIQRGAGTLPAKSLHGLIQHLVTYPDVGLATPRERKAAVSLLERIRAAARAEGWHDAERAEQQGYVRHTALRAAGDATVHYLHAELPDERPGGRLLDVSRPKALIYANAPGRRLVLVGVMYAVRRGERGPTPGGPITRWHSHLVCSAGAARGTKPPADGGCPPGSGLRQGSEMMHVWFTDDLRSAFAISAPERELCAAGLLPGPYCRTVDGRRRGM